MSRKIPRSRKPKRQDATSAPRQRTRSRVNLNPQATIKFSDSSSDESEPIPFQNAGIFDDQTSNDLNTSLDEIHVSRNVKFNTDAEKAQDLEINKSVLEKNESKESFHEDIFVLDDEQSEMIKSQYKHKKTSIPKAKINKDQGQPEQNERKIIKYVLKRIKKGIGKCSFEFTGESVNLCSEISHSEFGDFYTIYNYEKKVMGFLREHEMCKRFTYLSNAGIQFNSKFSESIGINYIDSHSSRIVNVVFPPRKVPYFPAEKAGNLSRIAKSENPPVKFRHFRSGVSPVGPIESVKNISLFEKTELVFSIIRVSKTEFEIEAEESIKPDEAFAISISSIIVNV